MKYSLDDVHIAAKNAGVGYSATYCESDDSWYFSVHSSAPSEEWIGKNRSFQSSVEEVIEFLTSIIKGKK